MGPIRGPGGVPSDTVQPVPKVEQVTKDPPKKEHEKKEVESPEVIEERERRRQELLRTLGKDGNIDLMDDGDAGKNIDFQI